MTTDWRNPKLSYEFSHEPDAETLAPEDWFIAQWPDGTWCDWDERHEYTHMSDDYEKLRIITFDGNGYYPVKTVTAF